jgi:hypothetical protein
MKRRFEKSKFLQILSEYPLVTVACKKSGIAKATIYRWMKDNPDFKKAVESAQKEGRQFVNDIAESGLISLMKEKNLAAIKYYLNNNDPRYVPKRSEFVFPDYNNFYPDIDKCLGCGRLSVEKEAERKIMIESFNKAIDVLSDPKNKKETKQFLNEIVENSRKRVEKK